MGLTGKIHERKSGSVGLVNSEERLWSSVIYRALRDTLSEDRRIRDEAIYWLTKSSWDLIMVCDMAGVHYRQVIRAANHLKELTPRAGYVYLDRLLDETRG